jgi:predicted lipid-binding transport protein (Tim44 family)
MEKIYAFLATTESIIKSSADAACAGGGNCGGTLDKLFGNITNALIFIIGGVSVIMVIIGALRFVTSNGDPKQAAEARQTILYAVVGVILAIASYAIVTFVTRTIHA